LFTNLLELETEDCSKAAITTTAATNAPGPPSTACGQETNALPRPTVPNRKPAQRCRKNRHQNIQIK
jgi:hypothetical protein